MIDTMYKLTVKNMDASFEVNNDNYLDFIL